MIDYERIAKGFIAEISGRVSPVYTVKALHLMGCTNEDVLALGFSQRELEVALIEETEDKKIEEELWKSLL